MINPVFVPLESLEAEEDNEPPSLEKRLDLFACPCVCMDSPAFGITSKPQSILQNSVEFIFRLNAVLLSIPVFLRYIRF